MRSMRTSPEGRTPRAALTLAAAAATAAAAAVVVAGACSADPAPRLDLRANAAAALRADAPVVISQVYGGGGNASAPFQRDFVELFNRGGTLISLGGWSVQYASATGTNTFASAVTALAGTIAPGQYYLVGLDPGTNGAPLPAVDASGTTNMSAGAGKVVLVEGVTGLACNGGSAPCDDAARARIVDLVGYGNANFAEGTAAPTLSNTTAGLRAGGGCTDTNVNAADFAARPPAPRNSDAPLALCPGVSDLAPEVAATTPAAGATDVGPGAPVIVTFTESVALAPGAVALACGTGSDAVAVALAQSGGPRAFTFVPAAPLALGASCTVTVTASLVHDTDAADPPDTAAADVSFSFAVIAGAGPLRIHDLQGAGHVSPHAGATAAGVPGVVTVLRSNGFFFEDPEPDGDPATSDGMFVFTGTGPAANAVAVGDAVLVSGPVVEFRPGCSGCTPSDDDFANLTTTEISRPTGVVVLSSGNPLPAPARLGWDAAAGRRRPPTTVIEDDTAGDVEIGPALFDPDGDGLDFFESLEGMRVLVDRPEVVGPTRQTTGGPEIVVVAGAAAGPAGAGPRAPRGALVITAADFNPERIFLALGPGAAALPSADVGDAFDGPVAGVVDYGFGNFRLLVTEALPALVPAALPREVVTLPAAEPASLTMATLNVENLDPGDPPEKLAALAAIIVTNLGAPDVLALEEVQDSSGPRDDGVVDAAPTIAGLLGAVLAAGGPAYAFRQIDPQDGQDGGEPGGNIRLVLLARSDRGVAFVDRPGGDSATANAVETDTEGAPHLRFSPGRVDPGNPAFARSRKPLATELTFNGRSLFVIANHFNSKGGDQSLYGRFQPPLLASEAQRQAQAQAVAGFVGDILALDPGAAVAVLGDLNDFAFSPPVAALVAAGLTPLVETLPVEERYSFVFEGNAQVLDHILVSPGLAAGAALDIVHVNAEYAVQSSDHDPSVARLLLGVAPRFDSAPPTDAVVGQPYAYTALASGTPAPAVALGAGPPGMTFDSGTGLLSWTPAVAPGAYPVTLRADNGVPPAAVQTFTVVVTAPPDPPDPDPDPDPQPQPRPVVPFLDCVERHGHGRLVARFGYASPNRAPVRVPVGPANAVFSLPGAPAARGQPTLFFPGRHEEVFRVPFGNAVTWHLQGRLAFASRFSGRTCR
jgi:predicted extracellular nuclease